MKYMHAVNLCNFLFGLNFVQADRTDLFSHSLMGKYRWYDLSICPQISLLKEIKVAISESKVQ